MNLLGLTVLVILAGAWELLVRFEIAQVRFLPAPTEIALAGRTAIRDGELITQLAHTVGVTVLGWGIASLLGVALGLVVGLSPRAYRYSMTSFEVTRAVPPITLVPAALLLYGFSLRMELVPVIYGATWPVLVNTVGGVRSMTPELRDVQAMLGLSRSARIRKIVVPAAAPSIVVGLRLALSLCLVLAIVAELVGNPAGLGRGLVRARQALRPDLMFVYVITAGLVGIALNAVLRAVVGVLVPGGHTTREVSW